ncbi:MAG: hypothetical protein IT161_24615 [Bryobacterales bacterium]|nr:hypothetical protein [Bryobacterales bacterium]
MSENIRRINLRFTPEYFDKLDEKRFRSRLSFQELGARLFDNWLSGDGDVPLHGSLRKPADSLLERLAIIQARGDKGLLALIQKAIDVSYSVMQHSVTPEELAHLKAVAYGEAQPAPKPQADEPKTRRGRARKIA